MIRLGNPINRQSVGLARAKRLVAKEMQSLMDGDR